MMHADAASLEEMRTREQAGEKRLQQRDLPHLSPAPTAAGTVTPVMNSTVTTDAVPRQRSRAQLHNPLRLMDAYYYYYYNL